MLDFLDKPGVLIVLVLALVVFGYKRLPDASRSLGRSMRIMKAEVKGLHDDDKTVTADAAPVVHQVPAPPVVMAPPVATQPPAAAQPVQQVAPVTTPAPAPVAAPAPVSEPAQSHSAIHTSLLPDAPQQSR